MTSVSAALRELAEPWVGGERVKVAIDRAARKAGLQFWRAYDLWYEKARCVQPFEITQIEAALAKKRESEARNELHELRLRLAKLESALLTTDEDFYRPQITALRTVGGKSGGSDSSLD